MSKKSRRTHAPAPLFAPSESFTHFQGDSPPEGVGHRHARIEHLLLDELQGLIRDEAADPALNGVTLLSVQLSADGGHARVAYAVAAPLHAEQERGRASKAGLIRATGFLRSRVAQHLNLKKLPKLTFTFVGIAPEGDGTDDAKGGEPCPE